MLSLKPQPFVQSSFDIQAPMCFFLFSFFVLLEMTLFPSMFCTISTLSLYGEYVVLSFLLNGIFLPCDHGLDFLHQLVM